MGPCEARLLRLDEHHDLASEWRDLETRGDVSVFQSWAWIGTLLAAAPRTIAWRVVRVVRNGRVVLLGLLGDAEVSRRGIIRSRSLFVSEAGLADVDALTVEHNGFVADRECGEEAVRAALACLLREDRQWDEIVVSGIDRAAASSYASIAGAVGLRSVTRWTKPYFVAEAQDIRAAGGEYLATLSGNTRYQVRRSMKSLSATGPLRYRLAENVDDASRMVDDLMDAHQSYWTRKGQPGAFATEFARTFHSCLVRERFADGMVQLGTLTAGTRPVGYLYNLSHSGVVSNYQSAFPYDADTRVSPGLVAHAMAIQTHFERGMLRYDMLAGDHRYKRSLATRDGEMVWLALQRPRLRFSLEALLKKARDMARRRSAG